MPEDDHQNITTIDDWVIDAVRFYSDRQGADVACIVEYIDYRDHFRYEAGEIEAVLKKLSQERKIIVRQERYFLNNKD